MLGVCDKYKILPHRVLNLHIAGYMSSFSDSIEFTAEALSATVGSGPSWHSRLLQAQSQPVASVRPATPPGDVVPQPNIETRRPSLATGIRAVEPDDSITFEELTTASPHGRSGKGRNDTIEYEVVSPASDLTPDQHVILSALRDLRLADEPKRHRASRNSLAQSHLHSQPSASKKGTKSNEQRYKDPLERLYHVGLDRKLAKQQWACLERAKRSQMESIDEECTFQPEVSPYAQKIQRPRGLSPENRAASEVRRKADWHAAKRAEQQQHEMEECTFKPLTLSAAQLHASALIQRADLHDKLHKDHAARAQFRERIQREALRQIEDKMVHKKIASSNASPEGYVTQDEVNAIVERLLHNSIHHVNDDPVARGETFHPTINPISEKIALQSRDECQTIVERLLHPRQQSRSRSREREGDDEVLLQPYDQRAVQAVREGIATERKRQHAGLLFNIIAEKVIEEQRDRNSKGVDDSSSTVISEEALSSCELPTLTFLEVARRLLPSHVYSDVLRGIRGLQREKRIHPQNVAQRITRKAFVGSLLRHSNFSSTSLSGAGERTSTARASSNGDSANTRTPRISSATAEMTKHRDGDDIVERLARLERQKQERLASAQQERKESALRAESENCTFAPKINKMNAALQKVLDNKRRQVAAGNERRPTERDIAEHREDPASNRCQVKFPDDTPLPRRPSAVTGVLELDHHTLPAAEAHLMPAALPPQLLSPYSIPPPLAPRSNEPAGGRSASIDRALATPQPSGLYRSVISEHAAFGPPNVLRSYGTLLMRSQLEAGK